MKTRWIVALVVVFFALFALRLHQQPTEEAPDLVTNKPGASATGSPSATSPISPTPPASPPKVDPGLSVRPPAPAGDNSPPPVGTPAPLTTAMIPETVREAMDNVQFALRDYRTVLGENPIGSNAEITKALTGDNLKQVKIPIPSGSSLNGEGAMCDHWGTPYFFHQLSGKQMEIHSAGPDRTLGTRDDLVVK